MPLLKPNLSCYSHAQLGFNDILRAFRARGHPRAQNQADGVEREYAHIEEKLQKILLIALAHAIVYPRTVMIHATYATLADATMMGTRWPIGLAASADGPLATVSIAGIGFRTICCGVQVREVQAIGGKWHNAGIGEDCLQMRHAQQEDDRIEQYNMNGSPNAAR